MNAFRCRLGHFHIVNNDYTHWHMYAIGGSGNPTILSQGNRFLAPNDPNAKEVIFMYISISIFFINDLTTLEYIDHFIGIKF